MVLAVVSSASAQPTLLSARRSFVDHTQVKVVFSEAVTQATATNTLNYGINNSVTVSAAGMSNSNAVILVTSPMPTGPAYTLTVNNVQNGGGQPIANNSQIAIQTSPLVPSDFGVATNGFQDDFSSATRDTNWIAAVPGGDPFTQANGVLVAGTGPYESPHLLYRPVDTPYHDSTQEILARIRIITDSVGYDFNYGIGAGVAANTAQGQHLIFRNNSGNSPPRFPLRHFLFVRFGINWGPGIYEPDATTPKTWQKETWYWLRLRQEFDGDGVNDGFAKVWLADGDTAEPANWSQVYNFAHFIDEVRRGYAGVGAAKTGSPGEARFDYVLIKADGLPIITPGAQAFATPTQALTLTITQQPQNATAIAGGTASFSVAVSSSWPLIFYQWQKKVGNLWQPVGTDIDNYTTPTLQVGDSGTKYRVVVSVPGTNVVSREGTLTVNPITIGITQQPTHATAEVSRTATFTVAATNVINAAMTYQWQRQSLGGGSFTNIPSAVAPSYTTPALTLLEDDRAMYQVVITIPGVTNRISTAATLTVVPKTSKPTLVSARRLLQVHTKVTVVFSEAVSNATVPTNYTMDGGTGVTGAAAGADARTIVLTVSPAIPNGAKRTLTVNQVQDLFGNTILPNSQIAISLAPLTPYEIGTTVNGYQDDFFGPALDANWLGTPGSIAESGQAFTQIGSGVGGYLQVGKANREAPTLQYRPAGGYDLINQEVLARVLLTGVPSDTTSGDALKGGVGVSGHVVTSDAGIYALFRNTTYATPGGFPLRHAQFLRPSLAWGPGFYTDDTDTTAFTWSNDTWYWIRLRQEFSSTGPDALAKMWLADGDTPEPETWGGRWDFASTIEGMRQGHAGIVAGSTRAFAGDGNAPIPGEFMNVDYVLIKATGLPSIVVQPNAFDAFAPTLLSAALNFFNSSQVVVTFSEAVPPGSAGNYSMNNGATVNIASQGTALNEVVLDVSGLASRVNYTLTVNNLVDLVGNAIAPNSRVAINTALPPPRKQDTGPNALVVLEAEHANRNIPSGGTEWVFTKAIAGFSGSGAMQALPNTGRNVNINTEISPRLDFRVLFVTTGTHYVWLRGLGDSAPGPSADDSVNVGLDNTLPATSDRIGTFPRGAGFVWSQSTLDGVPATFEVLTPGEHIVTIWMREDGFIADKLLMTTNSTYVPSGLDASESAVDQPQIAIAPQRGNLVITWTATAVLQSARAVTGPWNDVLGAASPYLVSPTNTQSYFRLKQ